LGPREASGLRIVAVGEILWDVIGEHEYLGGAPLNLAAHVQTLGHEAFLVSAVGDDDRGRRTLDCLRQWGLSTEFVQVLHGKDTGTAQVELDCEGKPTFRIVRPAAYDFVTLSNDQLLCIAELQPDWIYFGTLYRSEEHTSELQSPCNLVCRLLLEKTKQTKYDPSSCVCARLDPRSRGGAVTE